MENYIIQCEETEREHVLELLNRSNDIIVNNVEPTRIGITIQLDDAEAAYQNLLNNIEAALKDRRNIVVNRPGGV